MALQSILKQHNITALAVLESTKAQTTLSQTELPSSGSSGLSGGAIAGIVIGCIVGVALLAAAAIFGLKYYRQRQASSAVPAGMCGLRLLSDTLACSVIAAGLCS